MNDDRYLDDLEHYLQRGKILEVAEPQLAGAHGQKVRLLLEGGVLALAKPEAGIGEGARVVRREVAAWIFARELGLADMVACTVLREDVPLLAGGRGTASVQVIWPQPFTPDHQGPFPDDDRWRAGILDAVIAHNDRGHNWLGLGPDVGGEFRLKLVDHGYAFEMQGGLNSIFYTEFQGQPVPTEYLGRLRSCCASPRQEQHLNNLFETEPEALENALGRANQMAESGILAI
jgi:hypothetical protein